MRIKLSIAGLAALLCSCVANDPDLAVKRGTAFGALSGAAIGKQLNERNGAEIGAVLGVVAGNMISDFMEKQQRSISEALDEEQKNNTVKIQKLEDQTIKIKLQNEVTFEFDSAEIRPAFEPSLEKMSSILVSYKETVAHIMGYTDNTGASEYNRLLSQRRARSIATYLVQNGVDSTRIKIYGLGDKQPQASNETEEGRTKNRRVEIYIRPIIEGREELAFELPRY